MKGIAVQPPLEHPAGKGRLVPRDQTRIGEALKCFNEAIRLNDKNGLALMHKAMILCGTDRYEESIGFFDLAIRANPDLAESWGGKAIALAEIGRIDEAIACCDEYLIRDNPLEKIRELRENLATFKKKKGILPAVPLDYNKIDTPGILAAPQAAAGSPSASRAGDLAPAIWQGRKMVLAGKKKEAIHWFEDLIAKYPTSDQLWVEKGIAVSGGVQSGNLKAFNPDDVHEAIRCFEKAVKINPRCTDAYIQQGMLYYEMLDFTEAHTSLDKALAINPSSIPAMRGKAMTYAEAARFSEAVDYCDRCLKLDNSLTDIRQLRDKYADELKKPRARQALPGICFKEQFHESPKTPIPTTVPKLTLEQTHEPITISSPAPTPAPEPAKIRFDAELGKFHKYIKGCYKVDEKGKLIVNMEPVLVLVKENPDLARRYVVWCCSDPSLPFKALQILGFIGVAIQMLYNDQKSLDMIEKRAQEFK
jgi:tetratricopeptide (TPR) repeat protein